MENFEEELKAQIEALNEQLKAAIYTDIKKDALIKELHDEIQDLKYQILQLTANR